MPQNASVELEFPHNYKGTDPSLFLDIEDVNIRCSNRGAILANIFERYTTRNTRTGAKHVLPKDLSMMLGEMDVYLSHFPSEERGQCRRMMEYHLSKRGYNET